MRFHKGKYVRINKWHPEGLGVCDYSGYYFNRKDLVRQMEWRGNSLAWTGYYVGRPFLDKPNEQLRPPILPPDPIPLKEPRPMQPTTLTFSTWTINGLPPFNLLTQPLNSLSSQEDGTNALPENERLSALQNLNWSTV